MYIIGLDPTQTFPAPASGVAPPQFTLGQLAADARGNIYRFVRADAGGVTDAGFFVIIEGANNQVDMLDNAVTVAGVGQGFPVGVAMAPIPVNGFGWVCVHGLVPIRVGANCALGTQLNCIPTVGAVDDDATATRQIIDGVSALATNGGATGNVNGYLTWPRVGRTI